jgi:hypothetical protein
MADEPEDDGTIEALVTAEFMTYDGRVYIAPGGWAKVAKTLKTPLLKLDMGKDITYRLCRASNGTWAWRDITAPDVAAAVTPIKGGKP